MDASFQSSSSHRSAGARVYLRPSQPKQPPVQLSPAWLIAGALFLLGAGALGLALSSRR